MGQFSINMEALEDFRVLATSTAGQFGAVGDSFTGSTDASIFGKGPGGQALARAMTAVGEQMAKEFAKAEEVLRGVAEAVDGVYGAARAADADGALLLSTAHHEVGSPTVASSAGGGTGNGGSYGGGFGGGGGGGGVAVADPNSGQAPPVNPGTGVNVNLPGGKTVEAPNAKAAGAVRAALSQLGTPYVWGGTSPGQGFDCSGLTQWSYAQEGIELERKSTFQTEGTQVAQENLAPGDLVVWEGHVAMYIGDGQMIEAPQPGDVVHIRPLRTTNAGDAFLGFWRPTA